MAKSKEIFFWLLWMMIATLYAYYYFSFTITIAIFLSGVIVISKIIVEDFLQAGEDEKR